MADVAQDYFDKFTDPATGYQAVIDADKSEGTHIDYKEVRNTDGEFTEAQRLKLAEYVSAFSNNDGGVLVWGVNDKTKEVAPIQDVAKFRDNAVRLTTELTMPVTDVRHAVVLSPGNDGTGVMVTHVPQAIRRPVQVILKQSHQYWLRYGDKNITMSDLLVRNMMLATAVPSLGMALSEPNIKHGAIEQDPTNSVLRYKTTYAVRFKLILRNTGTVSAKNIGVILVRRTPKLGFNGGQYVPIESRHGLPMRVSGENEPDQLLYTLEPSFILYPDTEVELGFALVGIVDPEELPPIFIGGRMFADGFGGEFSIAVPPAIISGISTVKDEFEEAARLRSFEASGVADRINRGN